VGGVVEIPQNFMKFCGKPRHHVQFSEIPSIFRRIMTPNDPKATAHIEAFNTVVSYFLQKYLEKYGKHFIPPIAEDKLNKELATKLSKPADPPEEKNGVVIRPKWIADLRVNQPIKFRNAHSVFYRMNSILKEHGFEQMPDVALKII